MEERMTVCNMSIEAGARAGMIAPDETTVAYLAGRPRAPSGAAWDRAVATWRELRTDPGATYDKRVELDASEVAPQVTWGTSPGMVTPVTGRVPSPSDFTTDAERRAVTRALEYMGLAPGTPLEGLPIDRVFLGSCTNARIEDLRAAARTVRGRHVATGVRAMVVPGSQQVKAQAEREGLDRVFSEAGFEWRNAGCSMCLGMNPDVLQSGERCASTSNRNFEGRQGRGGRTDLMSPPIAAAAAVAGHIVVANGCQDGLGPVRLLPQEVAALCRRQQAAGGEYRLTVDLGEQGVHAGLGFRATCSMEPYRREMLLTGSDQIGRSLREESR